MSNINWLGSQDEFPNPIEYPDPDPSVPGLIAVSDRIYPGQLARAYQMGIFPWYSDNQPVLWWSPNPRMVLKPKDFKCHDSLKKSIRHFLTAEQKNIYVDEDFGAVVRSCATARRKNQDGTWITHEIMDAYTNLYEQGHAHSIAIKEDERIIGGLYCVSFGGMIFGESMFSHQTGASKIALAALAAWCQQHQVEMIDCQQETAHLDSLGGAPIPRHEFLTHLQIALKQSNIEIPWKFDKAILRHWL
ncbi:leucyl/phenylalanyl-tRNA--protein transferase [Polynucleobacter sp. UK-Mo-2m-Kol15]|uniref:leucyl/phenylalanyl-tRNA--protein transferase n=1 Tax=Polynucleobacter sp. UK-Mo-2m-Kol15 TaxID=2576916 RepID=UPI001C0D83DA|nr:leucyl/phenylalanyl-tRNA--protein transferase [Polynucleobacter sp. UK-Mo-2m-Kol15]MBU3575518.1 leucyl/phenylalanyl-tRNA--protein transferase [Polynucleobacter sp. UK-Mo-2m-Kol15]